MVVTRSKNKVAVKKEAKRKADNKQLHESSQRIMRPRVYKSFTLKAADMRRAWHVIDARGIVLGRMASQIATLLRGKHKVEYTPHMDCGDGVIVINAREVALTGKKMKDKVYYRHTGYPGGIKERRPYEVLAGKNPEFVIKKAVQRMLGHGPLARHRLKHLRVYGDDNHPHAGLSPRVFDFASINRKNKQSVVQASAQAVAQA